MLGGVGFGQANLRKIMEAPDRLFYLHGRLVCVDT